jgi:hypothetical protein
MLARADSAVLEVEKGGHSAALLLCAPYAAISSLWDVVEDTRPPHHSQVRDPNVTDLLQSKVTVSRIGIQAARRRIAPDVAVSEGGVGRRAPTFSYRPWPVPLAC